MEKNPSSPNIHSILKKSKKVIKKLKKEIQEYIFLDKHINNKNERLETHISKLQDRNDKLIAKNRKLKKEVKLWCMKDKNFVVHNRVLKKKLKIVEIVAARDIVFAVAQKKYYFTQFINIFQNLIFVLI